MDFGQERPTMTTVPSNRIYRQSGMIPRYTGYLPRKFSSLGKKFRSIEYLLKSVNIVPDKHLVIQPVIYLFALIHFPITVILFDRIHFLNRV